MVNLLPSKISLPHSMAVLTIYKTQINSKMEHRIVAIVHSKIIVALRQQYKMRMQIIQIRIHLGSQIKPLSITMESPLR